jgi:hypothetical protein
MRPGTRNSKNSSKSNYSFLKDRKTKREREHLDLLLQKKKLKQIRKKN